METISHTPFIIGAYAIAFVLIFGLGGISWWQYRKTKRKLAQLKQKP